MCVCVSLCVCESVCVRECVCERVCVWLDSLCVGGGRNNFIYLEYF